MLRILAPVAALGLIVSPALAATQSASHRASTRHTTVDHAAKPTRHAAARTTTTTTSTATTPATSNSQ